MHKTCKFTDSCTHWRVQLCTLPIQYFWEIIFQGFSYKFWRVYNYTVNKMLLYLAYSDRKELLFWLGLNVNRIPACNWARLINVEFFIAWLPAHYVSNVFLLSSSLLLILGPGATWHIPISAVSVFALSCHNVVSWPRRQEKYSWTHTDTGAASNDLLSRILWTHFSTSKL